MSNSIEITENKTGLRVSVHVTPGAKRTQVGGRHGNALRIAVSAAPEKGQANKAVLDAVSQSLQVRRSQCSVVSGLTSRSKTIEITIDDPAPIRLLLQQLADKAKNASQDQ